MKNKLLSLIAILVTSIGTNAQTARVMAIHNSADPTVDTVDVWIVTPIGSSKLVDNLAFRQSTGFVDAPAGVDIRLAFGLKNSAAITDTLVGFGFNLTVNQTYVLLAQGNVGPGFNPQRDFKLHVVAPAFERNTNGGDSTTAVIVHGSADAPNVDVAIRKGNDEVALIENLAYDANTGYVKLAENDYFVDVMPTGMPAGSLITFAAPLKALNIGDSALVIFASGYLNPAINNNGKDFGLYVALSNGTVLPLPAVSTFRLQAFHNCADPVADTVDVWLINRTTNTNTRLVPNFIFRKATPFIDAPANQNIAIGVTLPGATIADTVYVENIGGVPGGVTVIAVASGVLDTSNFEANPSSNLINFEIFGLNGLERSPELGKVALQVFHGATDAPAVDINARGVGTLFGNLQYGESGMDYLTVAPQAYTIDIVAAGSSSIVASYTAPLQNFTDSALVVFASGYLSPNMPVGKDQGKPFALIAVTPSGATIELPMFTGVNKIVGLPEGISIYPNPAEGQLNIDIKSSVNNNYKITITDLNGRTLLAKPLSSIVDDDNGLINLNGFAKGMYFIHFSNNEGTTVNKFIVK
ncbi:MAG: T9SS type A sorting domain-containing protein [Bacteroidia bacterium]|nr:T9SS type A sorting domain-containing protein [Bacteroidia bacterium]MBP9690081.1 T9SS type A sorting domain-containing protein [Bacteroidia bacterium]